MDSKTFLSTLDPATRLQLTARHPWVGYAHLAGHVGAILITGTLIAFQVPFWGLLLPVHGILMVFVFTLGHECTHRTPFASDRACDLAGHATGLVLILPFHWFRAFHLSHHRHTNVPGQDPELEGGKPETLRAWLWHVSGIPIWISQIRTLVLLAFGRFEARYISERTRQKMEGEARILLVLYTCAAISLVVSPVLLWVWIVPLILGQPFLRLYLLAEHGDCSFVDDMFLNTRTTFTTRLTRFIAWNMPYHAEHYTYPMVPFHNLPALHKQMKAHLGVTSDGYTDFTRGYLARRRSV